MDLNQKSWYDEFLSRENSVIIDVRTPEEFSDFRIPNSININFYDSEFFFNQVSSLDKTKNYFIYCKWLILKIQPGVQKQKIAAVCL